MHCHYTIANKRAAFGQNVKRQALHCNLVLCAYPGSLWRFSSYLKAELDLSDFHPYGATYC